MKRHNRWLLGIGVVLGLLAFGISAILEQPLIRIPLGDEYYRGVFTVYSREQPGGLLNVLSFSYLYRPIPGADAWTFRSLGDDYAVDRHHAYFGGQALDAPVDLSTFRVLHDGYAVDSLRAYDRGVAMSVDLKSFVILPHGFARDAVHVFKDGLQTAFPAASFQQLPDDLVRSGNRVYRGPYLNDASMVYKIDRDGGVVPFDARSFQYLGRGFVRDPGGIYRLDYYSRPGQSIAAPVANVEAASFEITTNGTVQDLNWIYEDRTRDQSPPHGHELLPIELRREQDRSISYMSGGYITTRAGVAYGKPDHLITAARSFAFISKSVYAQDGQHVFYEGETVAGADPRTFQVLDSPSGFYKTWAFDATHAYRFGEDITKRGAATERKNFETALAAWKKETGRP